MKKGHYAWAICIACLLLFLCNMGLCSNILTIYLPFIEADGISDGMGSAILSVRCLFSFVTTFFVGVYYQKFSLRRGLLLVSAVGIVFPLVFCVAGGNPFIYYLGAALAGIAYGAGCIYPASLLLSNWFHSSRGFALGISAAGSGIATMLFSPLLSSVVVKYSLQAAFLLQSGIMAVAAAAVFLIVRDTPKEKGLLPYGESSDAAASHEAQPAFAPPRHMMWMLALMMLLSGGSGLAFSGHLAVLMRTEGYSAELAAAMVSLFGFVLVVSKLITGAIADRIGPKQCSILLFSIFILGCFFVLGMNGKAVFWCFALAIALGIGSPIFNVGPPLWAADLSSREHYAKTLKWLQIFYNLGGIIFTVVPGLIADHTHEYKSSFLMFAGMMLVGLAILLWAYRRRQVLASR